MCTGRKEGRKKKIKNGGMRTVLLEALKKKEKKKKKRKRKSVCVCQPACICIYIIIIIRQKKKKLCFLVCTRGMVGWKNLTFWCVPEGWLGGF